ncbi:hypothetical protein [Rhizobium sp. TRM95796]|uniref:hypothetical protein n=1 Tax=Rhizobium sp. TRM95796 TaxID=2979862 RepID=UPI0021E8F647|nr:hypothetical protein [Rhizobium sp. TRM95796]MCV3768898.1 hypothetical protein [Rhizobium sp. TRM95796]
MSDRFPLRPDETWHAEMRARYGDAVPALEHMRFRRGLQTLVADFFEQFHDREYQRLVAVHSIVTRNAGFVVLDARGHFGLPYGEYGAVDALLSTTQERLSEACEHCGAVGEIVAKTGLEALLDDPDAALGDRLLCNECYEKWRHRDD